MLKLLRNVRNVYKQWRALPPEQREQFASDVQHIQSLVRELGGARAVDFVEGDAEWTDPVLGDAPARERDRAVVVGELKEETQALLMKMAAPAGQFAVDSTPLSVRLGGRLMVAGARRVARKPESPSLDPAEIGRAHV